MSLEELSSLARFGVQPYGPVYLCSKVGLERLLCGRRNTEEAFSSLLVFNDSRISSKGRNLSNIYYSIAVLIIYVHIGVVKG